MDSDTRSASSPERSLSTVLKGRRRKKTVDDSAPTLILPTNGNDSLQAERGGGLLRSSIDRGIDKLKDRASRSTSADPEQLQRNTSQDSGNSGGRRLSKLVPSASRRRRKDTPDRQDSAGSDSLTLAPTSTDASASTLKTLDADADADSFAGRGGNSPASSLLTEDSEPDSASRPTLTSRPSHVGYLTLSSPLIDAKTVDPSKSVAAEPTVATEVEAPSQNPFDAEPAAAPTEQRGRPLGDAAGASSAVSTTTRPKAPTLLKKLDVGPSPLSRTDSGILTETPSTLVTPPTPEQAQIPFSTPPSTRSDSLPAALPSFAHRRVKSASAGPSKLSTTNAPPLTPALEEVKTPGGSLTQPGAAGAVGGGGGGFFSSLFSTTQNAVTQFSNTFTNAPATQKGGRSIPASRDGDNVGPTGDEEVIVTNSKSLGSATDGTLAHEEPAIATLGSGDLKLSHLGIADLSSDASMTSKDDPRDDVVQPPSLIQDTSLPSKVDEPSVVEATADKVVADTASSTVADRNSIVTRPKSVSSAVGSLPGDATTPPRSIANGVDETANQRSGSVRSRISDRRKRHRNNSTLSGSAPSALAAALAASHSALVNPAKSKRVSGYPIANPKRNKDFHNLFRSVPEDDYLVEDYSSALQREILLHGRLYISERHICFSSNIMGWITNLVVSFDEVVSLEKKNTAMIFPNAIVIQTLHAKNTFASLINRDGTYDLLLGIWKVGHPNLKATEGGHALDSSAVNQKPEVAESMETDEDSEGDDDDDYEDDDDENGNRSFVEGDGSIAGSDAGDAARAVSQRVVSQAAGPGMPANGSASKGPTAADMTSALDGFPGPPTHAPTECNDQDSHYDKLCLDDVIPAPLGKVYSMVFGPLSGSIMRKFLEEQESADIQYEDDKKGMGDEAQQYSYSFIKKLGGSIGPKQTKCIVEQSLEAYDLQKAVSVTCSTVTPDVPSGGSFVTKTKYCLMWAPNNSTRLLMTCGMEWSGKSFLRAAIDKHAEAGQEKYGKDLAAFLKAQIAAKSPAKSSRVKGKGRKRKTTGTQSLAASIEKETSKGASAKTEGGILSLLGPVGEVLGPVGDILGPLISANVVLGALLVTVTFLWLRQSYGSAKPGADLSSLMGSQRLVAYEELWKREENELWSWLEDRINLDGLAPTAQGEPLSKQQVLRSREVESKLDVERMNERQIDDAIRVTEERLGALKEVIERKKAQKRERPRAS